MSRHCSTAAPHLFLALLLFWAGGCAVAPINPPLAAVDPASGYRFSAVDKPDDDDEIFVVLALSGGGTRAAAFSYGLMEALRDTAFRHGGRQRTMLGETDLISSVSGGSFTAAYYGLFRDALFTTFESTFLKHDIQGDLAGAALSPANWGRLASSEFDRIDLAAEYYDRTVFRGATFAQLATAGRRPFIVLNATDMSLGTPFEFTQDQFDLLCSDLSAVPVARAVAASSAFPGLLSPITFENYENCGAKAPGWVPLALDRDANPDPRYFKALSVASYRNGERPYIHLLDGGLADNIGLRGPYLALTSGTDSPESILARINQGSVKHVIVIAANAKTKTSQTWDKQRAAPGLLDVLGFVSSGPMDNYSFDTVRLLTEFFEQMNKDALAVTACSNVLQQACPKASLPDVLPPVDFHATELTFDRVGSAPLQRCLEGLPTSFSLPGETVDLLRQVARKVLFESASFREAMRGLDPGWAAPAVSLDPKLVEKVCGPISTAGL